MKRQWLLGVWALVGAPSVVILGGYLEDAQFSGHLDGPYPIDLAICLPGVCIGLGPLSFLSFVKRPWSRLATAAIYGVAMSVLAETLGSRALSTHAVLISMSQ